jgi:hypothetical protein
VDLIATTAWTAAILQAAAYVMYVRRALLRRIDPCPTSWLMWAYGTALVVILETDQGIHPLLRLLPIVCAGCSVLVATLCWLRHSVVWPSEPADRLALALDLVLTMVYIGISATAFVGILDPGSARSARWVLLVCASGSTLVSYLPLLRHTRRHPDAEHPAPWAVWTIAYATLLLATIAAEGLSADALQFLVYPAICMVLSAVVCRFSFGTGLNGNRWTCIDTHGGPVVRPDRNDPIVATDTRNVACAPLAPL